MKIKGDLDIFFPLKLLPVIKKENPDIVHIHSRRGADTFGLLGAKLSGRKVILSRRVDNPEYPPLARFKYGFCDEVITISRGIKEVLIKEGVPREKIECVPSAVDTDLFRPGYEKDCLRGELGVPKETKILGVVAQLIKRKGHKFLFDALPEVIKEFPDLKIIVFGKGPLETELRSYSKRLHVHNFVILAGFRTDLDKTLPCLDGIIHPALMEGLGVSLLQAAACGIPIIATRTGGIPEIVRDGINGFLVPPADPKAIAQALIRLLRDPINAREMGKAGREIACKEFSIEAMIEGNMAVYRGCLGEK